MGTTAMGWVLGCSMFLVTCGPKPKPKTEEFTWSNTDRTYMVWGGGMGNAELLFDEEQAGTAKYDSWAVVHITRDGDGWRGEVNDSEIRFSSVVIGGAPADDIVLKPTETAPFTIAPDGSYEIQTKFAWNDKLFNGTLAGKIEISENAKEITIEAKPTSFEAEGEITVPGVGTGKAKVKVDCEEDKKASAADPGDKWAGDSIPAGKKACDYLCKSGERQVMICLLQDDKEEEKCPEEMNNVDMADHKWNCKRQGQPRRP